MPEVVEREASGTSFLGEIVACFRGGASRLVCQRQSKAEENSTDLAGLSTDGRMSVVELSFGLIHARLVALFCAAAVRRLGCTSQLATHLLGYGPDA